MKYLYLWYDVIRNDLRSEWINSKHSFAHDLESGNDFEVIFPFIQPEHKGSFLRLSNFDGKSMVFEGILNSACSDMCPKHLCQIW